jgi:signal transduction histidine kinase
MTRRLLVSYLTVTLLVLVGLGVSLEVVYTARERERVEADTARDANVLATIYEDALEGDAELETRPAEEYRARTGSTVVVVGRDGISRVHTDDGTGRDLSASPGIDVALTGATTTGRVDAPAGGAGRLFVAVPVASGGRVLGAVRIDLDTDQLDARIRRSRYLLVGLAAAVLALVALIGWVIARSVTRPIRQLNAAAARYAAGDLTVDPGPTGGPPEIRALGETMSTMARRLDEQVRTQRRFVADASHQLRTPLTSLRLRLENLQSRLPAEPAGEVDVAIDETTRLAALVTSLLQLTSADERRQHGSADLAALTLARVETWSVLAESTGVALVADVAPGARPVRAEPSGVEQILDNLLENALNAAPAGTAVTVRVRFEAGRTELVVSDQGPGLTDEEKQLATQRFWRASEASEGSGLGLAIVESLAGAFGATLSLDDAPGGGLVVTVGFLAADPVADAGADPGADTPADTRADAGR